MNKPKYPWARRVLLATRFQLQWVAFRTQVLRELAEWTKLLLWKIAEGILAITLFPLIVIIPLRWLVAPLTVTLRRNDTMWNLVEANLALKKSGFDKPHPN